jgi:DNA polymerase-1
MNTAGKELLKTYMACVEIAMRMQKCGVSFDHKRAAIHRRKLGRRKREAKQQIQDIAKLFDYDDFNPNSVQQMCGLFYGKMGIKARHYSKITGDASLDEEALSELVTHPNELVRNVVRSTLRYRKNKKLLEYVDVGNVGEDGRVHISWNPTGARTGRWTSSPQLQNIPKPVMKKIKSGPRHGEAYVKAPGLRDIYVANRPGDWVVCADYDQLELRIAALITQDDDLIKLFKDGKDPHAQNAADMFGYSDPSQVQKFERDMAKVWIYQRLYDGTPEAIWKHVAVDFPAYTLADSYRNRETYDRKHPAMIRWHRNALAEAQEVKHIVSPLNGLVMQFYSRVEASKVYNYPVQSTAAAIITPINPKPSRNAVRRARSPRS